MKKIYAAFFPLFLLLFTACKKEHPADPYNDQLIGSTWRLVKIDAPNYINPPFANGSFTFKPKGQLEYVDINGNSYNGSWYITYHEETVKHFLYLSIVDPEHNAVISQFYDDIEFIGTEYFTAYFYLSSFVNSFYFQRVQ